MPSKMTEVFIFRKKEIVHFYLHNLGVNFIGHFLDQTIIHFFVVLSGMIIKSFIETLLGIE